MSPSALSGIKVIEYADFISGPFCGKLLADMGATVIKVETPGSGDSSRRSGPFAGNKPDPEASGLFLYLNTNKSGITLDLEAPGGLSLFKDLVKPCDIFITNHHPGAARKLGIHYAGLKKANPFLVYASVTPFGLTGPQKNYHGNNFIAFNTGGMASFTPDWVEDHGSCPPLQAGGYQADYAAGIVAATAALGALYGRYASGKGCMVDVSEQEAVAFALARSVSFYTYEGIRQDRQKIERSMESPVPCKDGYVELHIVEDNHWQAFREVIGNPEWTEDPLFKNYAGRCHNWNLMEENLTRWTMQHTRQEIYHLMQSRRVAFGPVNKAEDVLRSEHIKQRGCFKETNHPRAGKLTLPGVPFKMSAAPNNTPAPAPLLGQHNRQVYGGMLGLSREEIAGLGKKGII
ncbi:MAG: CoA transferase [Dehalococcoidia bacterium]|nr:CoA transferase [Dehalococcoidia bacterium]